jgi:hypothetical protein
MTIDSDRSALAHRRNRSRMAYRDRTDLPEKFSAEGLDNAIDNAITVHVTPRMMEAFLNHPDGYAQGDILGPLQAALRAAGFLVD